jgi:hypothetical protein
VAVVGVVFYRVLRAGAFAHAFTVSVVPARSLLNKAQICMVTFVKLQVSDLNLDHEQGYSAAS